MPQFYDSLSADLRDWALAQPLFFVASAPLVGRHINVSPKGLPGRTFAVFDGTHAAYIDHSGSGAETVSHLYENGRATVMFCSFDARPRIMRLFCTGRVVEYDQPGFAAALGRMGKADFPGARAVISLDIFKTSCGFAVPLMGGSGSEKDAEDAACPPGFRDRDTLDRFNARQVEQGKMETYRAQNNAWSLDGLAGMKSARRAAGHALWISSLQAWLRRVFRQREALLMGAFLALVVVMVVEYLAAPLNVEPRRSIVTSG